MFVAKVRSKGKNGKIYESILLRESFRVGTRVSSRTLAVLTHLPKWLISSIENAIANFKGDTAQDPSKDASSEEPIRSIANSASSPIKIHQGPSFGATWLAISLAKSMGIEKALHQSKSNSFFSQLALWRVCARLLFPGSSLLSLTRKTKTTAATRIIQFDRSWTENDLYKQGEWLVENQVSIEQSLFKPSAGNEDLFLYDVTSSYFEGTENTLAAFGYNRDQKKGKMQVTVGLLTDVHGEPCAIRVYEGNTQDTKTLTHALHQAKDQFQCKNIILVGDRGMIKSDQIKEIKEAGFDYITSITKAQIQRLIHSEVFNLDFFDQNIAEVLEPDSQCRYILRRNPYRQAELAANRQSKLSKLRKKIETANQYLAEHPKAKPSTQIRNLNQFISRRKINAYTTVQEVPGERKIICNVDEEKLKEVTLLDGCYVIKTELKQEEHSAESIHQRYKDLAQVEEDFRTLKNGHLEIRPWYVIKEENTRAHALCAMLTLKLRRFLKKAWAQEDITVEEGLSELEKICILQIEDKESGRIDEIIPEPTPFQAKLLRLAGVKLPSRPPASSNSVVVDTRVKLNAERKSA